MLVSRRWALLLVSGASGVVLAIAALALVRLASGESQAPATPPRAQPLATGEAIVGYSASWPFAGYQDLSSLADAVDVVAIGRVLSGRLARTEPVFETEFQVELVDVLRGVEQPAAVITVTQTGGVDSDGRRLELRENPLMVVGSQYLFFFKRPAPGRYNVWAGPEGRLLVESGRVFSLSIVNPDRPIRDLGLSGVPLADIRKQVSP